MTTSLYCLWSVMMTLAVFFLVPNVAWCHLGSALKAGTGTLTKLTLGDHVIFCTFNFADGKPPILSHVRVSREPQPRIDRVPMVPTSKIKSPSYQHKILQFHSNGQSGVDYYPTKFFSSGIYPSSRSSPGYPVASKVSRLIGQGSYSDNEDSSDGDNNSWEADTGRWEPNLLPEPEEPTFTPYIGARALTNIPGFFQHLRENIQAIYDNKKQQDTASPSETQPSPMASEQGEEREGKDKDVEDEDKSQEELVKMIATPTRRGYSSNSETVDITQPKLDGMANRNSRSGGPYTLVFQNQTPDEKTRELLHFLGHGKPEYPRANRYNPAFLFTNLGLGKRDDHSRYKHYRLIN